MRKIFLGLFMILSFIRPVSAEEVTVPTEGFKIEVERKPLENDNLTGAVDIKIYNNSNQTIGVLLKSNQSIGWLADKTIEDEYKIGFISSDYRTVLLYVKPHRFVAQNGFNLVMTEDKEKIDKSVSIDYATFMKTDDLNNLDINNEEQINKMIETATDKGTFTLNKEDKDNFKSNIPVSDTIENDIEAVLNPKESKTIKVDKGNIFIPLVIGLVVVSGLSVGAYLIIKKKKKEVAQ